jgi:sortase (surface protein transpeptidase)
MMPSYYQNYYELKKHLYKERYLEQKRKKAWEEEMYKKYNGEKNYYKQSLIDFGYLKISNSSNKFL